jgi:hypothetical protein
MSSVSAAPNVPPMVRDPRPQSAARAILSAGLLAGILDITAAMNLYGYRGVDPVRILQSVATGLLGRAAYKGGVTTAVLGTVLHFFIATGAAAVYYAASRWITFLAKHPVPSGLIYGVAVYFFMNLVVLPLSAVPKSPFVPSPAMIGIHMFCVGLPIAVVLRRR